jgi:lipopolysaccharide transport system ATP-binding protein
MKVVDKSEIVLEAIGLSKTYKIQEKRFPAEQASALMDARNKDGHFLAIDNISFELHKGDVLGIIGRNGSGKSTLLKILAEIVHPSSGNLSYNGRLMSILDIGSGFHPELTGRENAYMYGAMLGIPKSEISARIGQIIDFSSIGHYFDEPVKYYSNGMYLRVAFSVAFFTNTDILLLDEVLAVGDAEFMVKCHQRIREMIGQGMSIILVSHSMSDIIRLCNKCIWLDKGKVARSGRASDVVAEYLKSGWGAFSSEVEKRATSITWDEENYPNAQGIYLHSMSVFNRPGGNDISDGLDYNFPIGIDIVFHTPLTDKNFSFVIIIIDQYNVPIISTTHHFEQDDLFLENRLGPGMYLSSLTIPAKLLNVGAFKLQLKVIIDNAVEIMDLPNLLLFKVNSYYPRQNNALLATPITLASHFAWKTESLSDPASHK